MRKRAGAFPEKEKQRFGKELRLFYNSAKIELCLNLNPRW